MASKMAQIMEMKKELDHLKTILEIMKETEKVKKDLEQLKKEEESDEDDQEFNEECEECGAKMSSTKLTEEEFDEHPDREAGYCKHTGNWFCMKCRDFEEGSDESDEED